MERTEKINDISRWLSSRVRFSRGVSKPIIDGEQSPKGYLNENKTDIHSFDANPHRLQGNRASPDSDCDVDCAQVHFL